MFSKFLILFLLIFSLSCTKKEEAIVLAPVVPEETQLIKSDASVKSENGNTIITLSFGELTQSSNIITKKITIMNMAEKEKFIPLSTTEIDSSSIFSINSLASTCPNIRSLKKYEKCIIAIDMNQDNIGSFVKFLYVGKLPIPIYVNIQVVPKLICTDGYHLSIDEARCELDIVNCPSAIFPEGANEAYQSWDYTNKIYVPVGSCSIKTCNTLLYNPVYATDGSVQCTIKKYNVNIINNDVLAGKILDAGNNQNISCGTKCDNDYDIRSTITLVAQPNPGFIFSKWEGSSCNNFSTNQCLLNYLNKNELIFATFIEKAPLITNFVNTNRGITLTPNDTFNTSLLNLHFDIAGTDLTYMSFSLGGNCVPTNYIPYNGNGIDVTLTTQNTKKNYSVKFRNNVLETACFNFAINNDNIGPTMALISPSIGSVFGSTYGITIQGSCEANLPVNFAGEIGTRTINCQTGFYTETFNPSFVGDGLKSIIISQTDLAGNTTSNTYNFLYDGTPPSTPSNINDHSQTYYQYTSPSITYGASTDSNPITYEIAIGTYQQINDIMDWKNIGSVLSTQVSFLQGLQPNVSYYVSARAKDSLGNISSITTSSGFIYNNFWDFQSVAQIIKPNPVKASERFGSVISFNSKYQDLIVRGKSSTGKDAVYIFSKNTTTGKYEQKQILEYPYVDSDNFGENIATNGNYLYVSASYEDSAGVGFLSFNNLSDSGIVYVYTKNSITGSWTYDNVIKSNSIGNNNRFGIKIQATDTGVYILSNKDYARGNDGVGIDAVHGFLEFFVRNATSWVLTEEYKVPIANFVNSSKSFSNFYVAKPYVILIQDGDSSTQANAAYVYQYDIANSVTPISLLTTLGNFTANRIGSPTTLTGAANIEKYQACINYSNYKHLGRYLGISEYKKELSFRERVTKTDNSVTYDCNYVYNLATGVMNYQLDDSSSASYTSHIFKMYSDNMVRLLNTSSDNKYKLLLMKKSNFLHLNGEAITQTIDITNDIYNPADANSVLNADIFPSSEDSMVIDENELFLGTPNNDGCNPENPFIAGCTDSGAIYYIKRI